MIMAVFSRILNALSPRVQCFPLFIRSIMNWFPKLFQDSASQSISSRSYGYSVDGFTTPPCTKNIDRCLRSSVDVHSPSDYLFPSSCYLEDFLRDRRDDISDEISSGRDD
ncbi:hypothetical protein MPTK1_6g17840 [Marchantia polymorpha subsp. ruderalis]|uniref:Uncharacterized protein n=2 Tax=Marchantia polymorpha TaxID=3197 RepID=A0AAF6BT65_MARPO|nr:hypothetical protein MARPO_0145s0001 [Marchantia polymorpha]BBN15199.1 hypothetical protein Mp_6g17840 [Marchantia polymorpha subsp. ruderalis]|eukprot:PTQ29232.1 hypothetical protein MARPO_0145s0001 [Marchantia polymorpha]